MPGGPGTNRPTERISLRLPAETAAVRFTEEATRGFVRNLRFPPAAAEQLVAAACQAVSAAVRSAAAAAARRDARLQVHFDVGEAAVGLTVQLLPRRRRHRAGTVTTRLIVAADGSVTHLT